MALSVLSEQSVSTTDGPSGEFADALPHFVLPAKGVSFEKVVNALEFMRSDHLHLAFTGRESARYAVAFAAGSGEAKKLQEFSIDFTARRSQPVYIEAVDWTVASTVDVGVERFVRKEGVHSTIVAHAAADDQSIVLMLHRAGDSAPFSEPDLTRIAHVPNMLRTACALRAIVADLKRSDAFRRALLDHSRVGAAVLDQDARVLLSNKSFERLILMSNGVRKAGDTLFFDAEESQASLLQAIASFDAGLPRYFPVLRDNLPPLQAVCRPILDEELLGAFGGPRRLGFCLHLSDPRTTTGPGRDDMVQLFALSNAEASVAAQLARGANLPDVAKKFGISIHTVRSHLRRILKKTGARTQADLLRILSSMP